MCALRRADEDESGAVRFFVGSFADGYLKSRGPIPGYAIVAFHRRHVADLTLFTEQELAGFWQDVAAVAKALEAVFQPCHLNYNVLGNAVPHVHAHIVPRYLDDPSPGMPLSPWTVEPVEAEEFARQISALRQAVEELGSEGVLDR
jgi:diadenosine tetraphosphate (Ap4A) HIT family hydrolase